MVKSVLADVLTGFLALPLIIVGYVAGVLTENLRITVLLAGALFLLGGLIRGAAVPYNPWIKGLLVNVGSSIPVCIMSYTGQAFNSRPHLLVFLSASLLAAIAGVHVRRLWRLSHRRACLAVAGASALAVFLIAQLFVPAMLERLSTPAREPRRVRIRFHPRRRWQRHQRVAARARRHRECEARL